MTDQTIPLPVESSPEPTPATSPPTFATTSPPNPTTTAASGSGEVDRDASGRLLFRYVSAEEWREYRAILGVFAGTFFAELSPDDVVARLRTSNADVVIETVPDRLESLRRWGNLTVSSSIGNPSSLADYYRRRSRYLITSAGQEVNDLVEGILGRVEDVRDVSTGRLGALREALGRLADCLSRDPELRTTTPAEVAEMVRAIFDPHMVFTAEITQFFAALNQWQSRYDLTPNEFRFFAEIVVGYVSDRLDEIEMAVRPIGRHLELIVPHVFAVVERAAGGLAEQVDRAGLSNAVAVRRAAGSRTDDWANLAQWFVRGTGTPSRIEQLRREALSAIRTLTQNLARLSRSGIGASSRRSDFLRLAACFGEVAEADIDRLAAVAFGLYPCRHLGALSADHHDPVPSTTLWKDAPTAEVALTLRERGDTTNRGQSSPIRDRRQEYILIRERREIEVARLHAAESELLAIGRFDSATVRTLTMPALRRLQSLIAQSRFQDSDGNGDGVACTVARTPGDRTMIDCPEGLLELHDIAVEVYARG